MVLMNRVQKMEECLGKYKSWRAFVFNSYNSRFNELLSAVDSIAFAHKHELREHYLLEKANINNTNTMTQTHKEIAYDINSSRVVISRLLKAMEKEGKLKLNRNNIEIL